jgi:hypothetical protein
VEFDKNLNIRLLNNVGTVLMPKKPIKNHDGSYVVTEFVPYWITNVADFPVEGKFKRQRSDQ